MIPMAQSQAKPAQANENTETKDIGGVSGQRLRTYLDRIERLEAEKKALADDIKDIYAEAKAVGFDSKTLRKVYRLRLMNTEKRREEEELLDLYKAAVGIE
jgi:uncharacterized protein (UPF0335 family)